MKLARILLALAASFIAAAAYAEAFTVEYAEGRVEADAGKGFKAVKVGDTLKDADTLRLGKSSFAELSYKGGKIKLSAEGSFKIGELVKKAKSVASMDLAALGGRLRAGSFDVRGKSDAAGVRGSLASVEKLRDSYGDEAAADFQVIEEELAAGSFKLAAAAVATLKDKWPEMEGEADYYRARAEYGAGDTLGALKTMEAGNLTFTSPLFGEGQLFLAQLLLETQSPEEALIAVDTFLAAYPGGREAQAAYILRALCLAQLSKPDEAKTALKIAYGMDKESPLGLEAKRLLDTF